MNIDPGVLLLGEICLYMGSEEIKPNPVDFGPGALYRNYEHEHLVDEGRVRWRKGGDGCCWSVVLPNGDEFDLDCWSSDNPPKFWNRSGVAPNFTVTPSIWLPGRWHGYLTNGELREC